MPAIRISSFLFMIGLMPLMIFPAGAGTDYGKNPAIAGERLEMLLEQSRREVEAGNPEGLHTAMLAEKLADSLKLDYEKACAWEIMGMAWKLRGDNQQSISYLFRALSYFQNEQYQLEYAGALRNIGETNRAAGNLHQAMNFLSSSLAISVKLNDTAGIARTYDRMAATSYELHFSDSNAVKPEYQPLEHSNFDFHQVVRTDSEFRTKYDQTIRYINLARFYAEKAHLPGVMISTTMIRAALYTITYQFTEALAVYTSLEKDIQLAGAELELPLLKYNMALLYFKKKEFAKALTFAMEGYRLAEKLKIPQYQFLTASFIGLVHHRMGDFKAAYHYSHLGYLGRLAYFEKDINVKLRAMQLDYEIRNKQDELSSRKLQIILLILAITLITAITTLFIVILVRKNRAMRKLNASLELRVAERTRELEQSNRELAFRIREAEQYTYIASHDLREPLQTLTNFTGLLKEDYSQLLTGEGQRYLDFITQATDRMSSLVTGFLEYSLLEKRVAAGSVDCNLLMNGVCEKLAGEMAATSATVRYSNLPVVTGHDADLFTLFRNIVGNAIQYHRPGIPPVVEVSGVADENEWTFRIEDNGQGIPEKERVRVFDIFKKSRRGHDARSPGLGLAYCRKIVGLHGGRIWAEPAPGLGTIIIFTLPKP